MYARSCLSTASGKYWNYQEKQQKNTIMVLILGGPEPGAALSNPCGSLPAWDIPWLAKCLSH